MLLIVLIRTKNLTLYCSVGKKENSLKCCSCLLPQRKMLIAVVGFLHK